MSRRLQGLGWRGHKRRGGRRREPRGEMANGRADGAAIRLVTKDGRTLWGNEARARAHIAGSTSSSIAEHLAIAAVPR